MIDPTWLTAYFTTKAIREANRLEREAIDRYLTDDDYYSDDKPTDVGYGLS